MFKSKGFTAAFSVLAVLIVALLAFFCYLVFGKGAEKMLTEGYMTGTVAADAGSTDATDSTESITETETETEATTAAETTAETAAVITDTSVRALTNEETHSLPVIGEVIPEDGTITIIKSGDNGEGIVFHAKPQFDGSDAEGNVVQYEGSFAVTGKIYILNNDIPFVLYQTSDGLYCTSSPVYMSYAPASTTISADANKIGTFGLTDGAGVICEVMTDDGNEVSFSLYNYNAADGSRTAVLTNVIAKYNSIGVASFEYHYSDGQAHTGTISFESVADGTYSKLVDINFDTPFAIGTAEQSEIVLHK